MATRLATLYRELVGEYAENHAASKLPQASEDFQHTALEQS